MRGPESYLCFVCDKQKDYVRASRFAKPRYSRLKFKRSRWPDVYRSLKAVKSPAPATKEFLRFLKLRGLNPGKPLTIAQLRDFALRRKGEAGLKQQLVRYCEKLRIEKDWSVIPKRYPLWHRVE